MWLILTLLLLDPRASASDSCINCGLWLDGVSFRFRAGLQCFEGLKAYKSLADDSVRLFRPDKNMERLSNSMDRLCLPGADFDRNELIKCIAQLVDLDRDWIPDGEGYSLYLRPTVIATHKFLGLAPPDSLLLYVITCPVGPYYKSGFNPIKLTADTNYVRAWPGGTGDAKVHKLLL